MSKLTEEQKLYHKNYREQNKEKIRKYKQQYYEDNKDQIKKTQKEYNQNHTEERREYFKQYRIDHHDEKIQQGREYYAEHKEEVDAHNRENYEKNKEARKEKQRLWGKSLASISYLEKLQKYVECRPDPNNPELLQVMCKNSNCKHGGWFNPTNNQCMNKLKAINGKTGNRNSQNNFYCCDECKKSCPVFRRKTDKPKTKRSSDRGNMQKELKELLISERGKVCEKCGRSKEEYPHLTFICHHINPVKCDPILSADKDNCIIVCNECHSELHQLSGCSTWKLANL